MSQLEADKTDIVLLARALRPDQFTERIDYWRTGGFPAGGSYEAVAHSQSVPLPVDGEDGGLRDRLDRQLQEAARVYRANLDDAVRLLQGCAALEGKWLFAITIAPKDIRDLASDDPSCLYGCVRRSPKKPWRLKRGLCASHYQAWLRAGRPELPPSEVLRELTA